MKKTVTVLMLAGLAGCHNGYSESNFPLRPDELKDCYIGELRNETGEHITIARCPNSTTTTNYKSGKTTKATIVVDGVTYEEKSK